MIINTYEEYYHTKTIKIPKRGYLDGIVDECHVMLCDTYPKRLPQILSQLSQTPMLSKCDLHFNVGYEDKDEIDSVADDISLSLYRIFRKSEAHNLILVMEDDVILDRELLQASYLREFIEQHHDTIDFLNLGTPVFFGFDPFETNTSIKEVAFMFCAHAIIYSKEYRKFFMREYETRRLSKKTFHVDSICNDLKFFTYTKNNGKRMSKYLCTPSLAYQIFPKTSNYENWPWYGKVFQKVFFEMYAMDIKPLPGWRLIEMYCDLFNALTFLIIFVVCIWCMSRTIKRLKRVPKSSDVLSCSVP